MVGEKGSFKRSRKGGHGYNKQKRDEERKNVDFNSPIIQAFSTFQKELDEKHDRYERLVKLSRDITIESKRIIFLLHRITGDADKDDITREAFERLSTIQSSHLSQIAEELASQDISQFLHAFTAGLQEYIEAVAFYVYVNEARLVTKREMEERYLQPKRPCATEKGDPASEDTTDSADTTESEDKQKVETSSREPLSFEIPPLEFVLGLADFTGELMRLCINSIGNGDLELPFEAVDFLRKVYDGFQLIGNQAGRELTRKVRTLRQSLWKVENVCYTLQVRGSEIPKHMLLDVINKSSKADAGYDNPEAES